MQKFYARVVLRFPTWVHLKCTSKFHASCNDTNLWVWPNMEGRLPRFCTARARECQTNARIKGMVIVERGGETIAFALARGLRRLWRAVGPPVTPRTCLESAALYFFFFIYILPVAYILSFVILLMRCVSDYFCCLLRIWIVMIFFRLVFERILRFVVGWWILCLI